MPRIVLVRSRNALNIGAVARAMANFGLGDLVLVDPYEKSWTEAKSARAGIAVLRQARAVGTMAEALSGCHFVVGTTDGAARVPELPLEPWETVAAEMPATGSAIVFGSEKTGLSVEDISLCTRLARLPTQPDAPSMNLGQAVAVCAYELARSSRARPAGALPAALSVVERERLLDTWYPLLEQMGTVRPGHHASQRRALRAMITRWQLTPSDEQRLLGMARQVRHALAGTLGPKAS